MIDSHCHLADEVFVPDVNQVVQRAKAAGVGGALCILDAGSSEERRRAMGLAREWPELRFSVGVHPHHAGGWGDRLDEMVSTVAGALDTHPRMCAVGEIGLDYHYDFAPRAVQREVFVRQASLALDRGRPVVIHAREADDDALAVLREVGAGRLRGVMHCFTGSRAFAERSLELGLHISLAGIVTFPRAVELHEVARAIPRDRLLIETDSPFLAPVPHRGKRNEPAWVARVAAHVAELRSETLESLAQQTTSNYEGLFGLGSVERTETR